MSLPAGFTVRVRDDVERLDGGRLLVGGSPLRAIHLSSAAVRLLDGGRLTVRHPDTAVLARRLLAGNLADPVLGAPAAAEDLTVVIPVRDRPDQLDRALTALAGLEVIVVDDASLEPGATRLVTERHGARLVELAVNVGPGGARNVGLALARTSYVAFVDSDVAVTAATLRGLAAHFADPEVAIVGPQVRGVARSERPRWFERYDVACSSLALGRRACSVRPGAAVGWLPSACLVGRVSALGEGFDPDLGAGEDVDLVWRLVGAGHTVRYDPSFVAGHDARTTIRGWLGRKVVYGTGSAVLAPRHGDAVSVAVLSPVMAAAAAAVLLRRPWSGPLSAAGVAWGAAAAARALPDVPGKRALAARLALRGLGWALRQESSLLVRHWWPAALAACVVSRPARRAVASALVVDTIVALTDDRRQAHPALSLVGRRLDDLSYGAGLWLGAWRSRSLAAVKVRIVRPGRDDRGREAGRARSTPLRRRA